MGFRLPDLRYHRDEYYRWQTIHQLQQIVAKKTARDNSFHIQKREHKMIEVQRFWVQCFFNMLNVILVFCMVQLFLQAEGETFYVSLLSPICGNIIPTPKQKKNRDNILLDDEVDGVHQHRPS